MMRNLDVGVVRPRELKSWLHDGAEIALLDVREAGQFGECHLFLAIPLPYSRLELDIRRLVPRLTTRIVLVDDNGCDLVQRAAGRLAELGYTDLHRLDGGIKAWSAAGLEVFAGVNVPSKAFGELAELHFGTPHISAPDLAARLQRGDDVVILDGRPIPEYKKMSIPAATCCPNGELALRIDDLVPQKDTPIVINCAGRTRSIVGAQTLINLGVRNPVFALENGTQGWYLNDLSLDHGADRVFRALDASVDLGQRVERAQALADRYGIVRITAQQLFDWWKDSRRTTYLCDVRTPEESQAQPVPLAQSAPGGQLIQATDQYVATRGARIVLVDNDDVRAPVVATWLYMLGWDVFVLPSEESAKLASGTLPLPAGQGDQTARLIEDDPLVSLSAEALKDCLAQGVPVLDLRAGMQYRQGHVDGAQWVIRPNLPDWISRQQRVPARVVLMGDVSLAALVARDLRELGVFEVLHCALDMPECKRAGLTVVATPGTPSDAECIDYLFFVHDRHDGNKQAAMQYLAWETNLIAQLDDQEKAMYRFKV